MRGRGRGVKRRGSGGYPTASKQKAIQLDSDEEQEEEANESEDRDRDSSPEVTPAPRRLKCKLCSQMFDSKDEWSKHLRETHAQDALVSAKMSSPAAENSGDDGTDSERLRTQRPARQRVPVRRSPDVEEQPSFKCTDCTMVFNTKRGLAAHKMHRHRNSLTPRSSIGGTPVSTSRQLRSPKTPGDTSKDLNETMDSVSEIVSEVVSKKESKDTWKSKDTISKSVTVHTSVSSKPIEIPGLEQESEEPEEYEMPTQVVTDQETENDNFPCRKCKDRIFLTSFGLERHTKLSHPENMEEVYKDIKRIQDEKQKKAEARKLEGEKPTVDKKPGVGRKFAGPPGRSDMDYFETSGRGRGRGSPGVSKRRYSTKVSVEKENEPSFPPTKPDTGEVFQMVRQQRAAIVASASFTDNRAANRNKRSLEAPKAKYQSCEICGILINTEHPKAMDSHTKAHQKNQELRQELLRLYGPSWVDNVTCRECNLVFKDEEKLEQHRRNVHVRRRHFLCRFCGDVFRNMRDLNLHKERRHEAFEGHRRNLDGTGETPPQPPAFRRPMGAGQANRGAGYAAGLDNQEPNEAADGAGNAEEFSCRTVCEMCGLQMVRPSNLIRHMKQAHNKTNFTATVETRGMPPFKIDVFEGQFMWGCCDEVYDDRQAFINHRRLVHGPSYVGNPKECEHCGLSFKNNVSYINHLRTHRPRVCHICGESFGNTAVDLSSYRVHMLKHRDQGYNIRFSQIDDELAQKENQDLWKAIEEEEADDESEDDYSIFSSSGVESDGDENSELDEKDDGTLLTSCPICDKRFACVYRFGDHWSLHCKQATLLKGLELKTVPFDYRKARIKSCLCKICHKRFANRTSLSLHTVNCMLKRFGEIPKLEDNPMLCSPTKSTNASPTKSSSGESPVKSSPFKVPLDVDKPPTESDVPNVERPTEESENASRELEDSLDVGTKEKQPSMPLYVEKAYVVEWDTNKLPPEHPYLCRACDQPYGDFLSLIMHVKTHITHPIYDVPATDENKSEEKAEGILARDEVGQDENVEKDKPTEQEGMETEVENAENMDKDKVPEKEPTVTASVLRIRTTGTERLGKFACVICSRRFADNNSLDEHTHLTHSTRRQFYCALCGKKFWTAEGLNEHSKRHDAINFYCNECDKHFRSMETLNKHEIVHELTKSLYQCEECAQSFYGVKQLKQHFKQNHQGVTILTCYICARIHTDAESLRDHFETEHADCRSRCGICYKSFKTPMQTRRHAKRVHLGNGNAKCAVCSKVFGDKRRLAVHMWRHKSSKGYQCLLCDASYENDEGVRVHLEKDHSVDWIDSRDLIVDSRNVKRIEV